MKNFYIFLLVVLGGITIFWLLSRPQPILVTLVSVERGSVATTVVNTRAGTVDACRRAELSPALGGQISRLPVSDGDYVEEGQLLLELWNADLKAERFGDIIARGLSFQPTESVLREMLEQFQFHSKDDSDSTTFRADGQDKRQSMSVDEKALINEVCGGSYRALNNAPENLFPKSVS